MMMMLYANLQLVLLAILSSSFPSAEGTPRSWDGKNPFGPCLLCSAFYLSR